MREGSGGPPRGSPAAGRRLRGSPRRAATRARILLAATRLFSEDGFRRVTVRDICREARVNLSSVSYYFGDKLGLYREIVEGAIEEIRASDPTIRAPLGTPAADRIRHYVRTYLPRLARPRGPAVWMQKLMRHELEEPTPLAPWIAERVILPRIRYLGDAIAELLGCPAGDSRVERCLVSLQAQCLFYMPNRFRAAALPGWREWTDAELELVAEHIAEFSLAGIRRMAGEA